MFDYYRGDIGVKLIGTVLLKERRDRGDMVILIIRDIEICFH